MSLSSLEVKSQSKDKELQSLKSYSEEDEDDIEEFTEEEIASKLRIH